MVCDARGDAVQPQPGEGVSRAVGEQLETVLAQIGRVETIASAGFDPFPHIGQMLGYELHKEVV